ncbi:MAG: alpha-galactosidase [Verrucomicrobia bacterium]|nr:alpha-galactosidase [Verrucomicrobiota bacterium]
MKLASARKNIRLGKMVEIEALLRDAEFLGLGRVVIDGAAVRSDAVPWRPCVETSDGFSFTRLFLKKIEPISNGVALRLEALGEPGFYSGGRIDFHYERVPSSAAGVRRADLDILLEKSAVEIEGLTYTGFSMRYVLRLHGTKAFQLLDKGDWEIGGRATGNIIVSQSQCCEPEHHCARASSFHTWVANARIVNNRDTMDFLSYCFTPRFGSMQCFDFLDAKQGSLLVFYDRMEHIKGSVFKESGQEVIHHQDLCTLGLTDRFEPPAKHVLLHKTTRHETHEFRNRWTACRDFVFQRYQKQYGIREDYPQTEYHSWLDWKPDHYTGHHVYPKDASHWFYDMARVVVPAMKKMGFERFFDGGLFKSHFTENPAEHHPNFTMYDYVISDQFGGNKALAYFCGKCRAQGLDFSLWLNTGLGRQSPIFEQHPEWLLHDPHLGPYTSVWGHHRVFDLNQDGAFNFMKDRFTRLIREVGITGILHDSFPNMGSMKVNWRDPKLRGHMQRTLALMRYLQQLGMYYAVEGSGPFGVQHGGLGSTQDLAMGEVAYQWFRGKEYSLFRTCRALGVDAFLGGDLDNADYFRLLANQAPLCLVTGHKGNTVKGYSAGMGSIVQLGDEFARMQKAYNRARLRMQKRTLLPDQQGVLWRNNRTKETICYAFKNFALPVKGGFDSEELVEGEKGHGRSVCRLQRNRVYVIRGKIENPARDRTSS